MEEQGGKEGHLMQNHFWKIGEDFVLDRLVSLLFLVLMNRLVVL